MEPGQSQSISDEQRAAAYEWARQYVIKQLGKQASRNDVIFTLTQQTGATWQQAEAFVEQIEKEHHSGIALRRAPILLVFAIPTIAVGLYATVSYIAELSMLARSNTEPALTLFAGAEIMFYLAIRLAMVIGGAWGIWVGVSDIWTRA